jgi:hypothetical protein
MVMIRKAVMLLLLSLFVIGTVSSEEYDIDEYKDLVFLDAALKFIFPFEPEIGTLILADFSANLGLELIPRRYFLGIGVDVGIGVDWFSIFSDEDTTDREYNQFGFSLGARIYNLIKFGPFYVIPFFGCDFLFIVIPMPYAGVQIGYKLFSFEYGYYFPVHNFVLHQISIKVDISSILY